LAGPHRLEAGSWDLHSPVGQVQRDYHVAHSEQAGLLWIYRERPGVDQVHSPWFLHGFFG
ncbi:MAG: hypothetical protein JWP52_2540, partial [Rhizobacter sp.]|nr:hypothetical protein [Rhizobacter sp.]